MVAKSTMYVKFCRALLLVLGFVLTSQISFAQSNSVTPSSNSINAIVTPDLKNKKFGLNIRGILGDRGFGNENGERAQQVSLLFGAKADYRLTSSLSTSIDFILIGASSQSVSRFGDNVTNSGLYLGESVVKWSPLDFFSIHAGALNQEYLNSPLLFGPNNTFPGVKQKLDFKFDKTSLEFSFEQTIPTSNTLSTKTVDREVTPSFYAETAILKTNLLKAVDLEIFGGLYQFKDLPTQIVLESATYGNSTPEFLGPNTARFMYEFSGWLAGANTKIEIPKLMIFKLGGHVIENMEAPFAYNQGQLAHVGTELLFSKDFTVEPRFEVFFNESDTAPAFFNSAMYGHNNRTGYAAEVLFNFKNPDFAIRSKYAEADTINFNVNQTKQQFFMIRLETKYDVL